VALPRFANFTLPRRPKRPFAVTLLPNANEAIALAYKTRAGILLDLDATIVSQGQTLCPEPVLEISDSAILMLADVPAAIVTNRRATPVTLAGIPVISRAGKPFTPARLLPRARTMAVIGDQYWTDGILAARLGARFYRISPLRPELRPWRAQALDLILRPFFQEVG